MAFDVVVDRAIFHGVFCSTVSSVQRWLLFKWGEVAQPIPLWALASYTSHTDEPRQGEWREAIEQLPHSEPLRRRSGRVFHASMRAFSNREHIGVTKVMKGQAAGREHFWVSVSTTPRHELACVGGASDVSRAVLRRIRRRHPVLRRGSDAPVP